VSPDRLHTTSYGEETPHYDNSREETRRLNRRAAVVSTSRNEEPYAHLAHVRVGAAIVLTGSVAFAQPTLATVRIGHEVSSTGKAAAGHFQIRLTDDVAHRPLVVRRAERWVEFLKGGQVVGRELASVIGAGEPSADHASPTGTTGTIHTDSARGSKG